MLSALAHRLLIDRSIALSEVMRASLVELSGVPAGRIQLLGYGIGPPDEARVAERHRFLAAWLADRIEVCPRSMLYP